VEEHHAIVGVHRAIDLAVQADAGRTGMAATLFPAYDDGAAGWSDAFARMLIDHGVVSSVEEVFPPVDEALARLAEEGPGTTWQAVRRLQAIGALVRVSPEHAPGGASAEAVAAALDRVAGPGLSGAGLHEHLLDPANLHHEGWREQVGELFEREGIS
jgi:hypothetical protein